MPPNDKSRWAAVDLDSTREGLEGRWARFIRDLERQGPDAFAPTRPDPRWMPTTTGEPPYLPGVFPDPWPVPRPPADDRVTLGEWMDENERALLFDVDDEDEDWVDPIHCM
jgi:hypothetical protein